MGLGLWNILITFLLIPEVDYLGLLGIVSFNY